MNYSFLTACIVSLCYLLPLSIQGQDITSTIGLPDQASRCGPILDIPITITNNTASDTTGLTATISFTGGEGIFINGTTPTLPRSGTTFELGTLAAGASFQFTAQAQVGCGFSAQTFRAQLTVGDEPIVRSTTSEVIQADLSMPSSDPGTFGVYLGLVDSVSTRVVNASFGRLDSFTYCVDNNHPALALRTVTVGGIVLPLSFAEAGRNCYTVTPEAMTAAGIGPTFDNGESLFPVETFEVVTCVDNPPDITRRVQYGCQGDRDCQEKPDAAFITTGVSFELVAPDIDVSAIDRTRPACYVDDPTLATIRVQNNGTAPAKDIRFRLRVDASRGMNLEPDRISVDRAGQPFTDFSTSRPIAGDACNGPDALRELDVSLDDINLAIGEFVDVTYEVTASCDCNSMDIRNKYWSRFQLRGYDTPCDDALNEFVNVDPNGRFDAFIQGIPEGPSSLADGGSGCYSYFVTDMQLDWLVRSFPEAYLEATFQIPCGLDYDPGTFTWRDRNGRVYPLDEADGVVFDYTDNNAPGQDDILRVRYPSTSRPGGFQYTGGASFDFCVTVDCNEKPDPVCGSAFFDEVIEAQFDFTTDPDCAAECAIQKIWAPQDLDIRIVCPSTDPNCACDGLSFTGLEVARTNFGLADDNNDQIPSGGLLADPELVSTDRFLQGDSLRVVFEGRVQDVDGDRNYDNGFIILPIGHPDFTPLGATISITRAGTTTVQTCGAVPITPDYVNNRIVLDIGIPALNALGCGITGGDLYQDGDSISVTLDYTESFDLMNQQFRAITYDPAFYLTEAPFDVGSRDQCNPRLARMTQVGLNRRASTSGGNFGSCELPNWSATYDLFIGGTTLDEFPFEIRPIGLPETFVFTKPAEFNHRLDAWDVVLRQTISPANNVVDSRRNGTPGIPPEFFIVNGDIVTLLVGDYFRSLGLTEVPPDEGYRVVFFPRIQGTCLSEVGEYDYSYDFTESVDEAIFNMSEMTRATIDRDFDYEGAAEIQVATDQATIRLCSGNDRATVRVRNVRNPAATNSFLYPEPTGQVIITRIEDADSGQEITPNEFGIYPLGTIGGIEERVLSVFFTKNTCDDATLDFVGGWDCLGTPETINDALCAEPSRINLTSARSAVDMLVTAPERNSTEIIELCDPIVFSADIISSDLGYVRDIVMNFSLPPNVTYDEGSFEIAVPSVDQGGSFTFVRDPVALGANQFEIDVSSLNPVLDTEGLVGAKNVDRNRVSVRFTASTGCGYFSGERVVFTIASNNSCADPLPPVTRESGRIRTGEVTQDIDIRVQPVELEFNACSAEPQTISTVATIGGDLTAVDSIRVLLPPGVEYIQDSYVPGTNAPAGANPTVVRDAAGRTALILPLATLEDGGNQVAFAVDVVATDIGQICRDYDISVDAYSGSVDECNGMICDVALIRGRASATAVIQKPDYEFAAIDGDISLNPTTGQAVGNFTASVVNQGFPLPPGNSLVVNIYDDTNGNGTYDPGTDVFLFPIDSLLTQPLGTGESITVDGEATFAATSLCTVIAVIDPGSTCACTTVPSATFRPEISYDFQRDYEICSNDPIVIGPAPVTGYNYRWLSRGGSDVSALDDPNTAMPTFTAPLNTTGEVLVVEYTVRISNPPCFTDEVVRINVAPLINENYNVQACIGSSFELPTTDTVGASNFVWSPTTGLTITDNGRRATVDDVQESATYTLTYSLGDGCDAAIIANLTAVDCGTTNTQLGDFVWFDFNMNGLQDPGEPGVAGVQVNLINGATGSLISTTETDADGQYLFDELPSGSYAVEVLPPPGFVFTSQNSGDPLLDSNVDPATGATPPMFVQLDDSDLTFDAGLIPDCSLEVTASVAGCEDVNGTLQRRLTVTAEWTGNPYAYDQFNDGQDALRVEIGGSVYTVAIDNVDGSLLVVDSLISPTTTTSYTVTAAFQEATSCTATAAVAPFEPCIYDLALIKTPSAVQPTPPPYVYGGVVCYDFTVENQGRQPVENVQVLDLLPPGLVYNANRSDLGWTAIGDRQLYTFPGRIEPGASAVATLCANLVPGTGGEGDFTNRAEIIGFADTLMNVLSAFDEDSTPDQDFTNDPGGVPGGTSDDQTDGNGTDDEDDSDPARISIYDLALEKMLVSAQPLETGDEITWEITVFNQGNEPASDIEVIDYIPAGLELAASSLGQWSSATPGPSGTSFTTATIAGPLAAGADTSITIGLLFSGVFGQAEYVNRAEISADDGVDIDSDADQNPDNDPGGAPETPSDGAVLGVGTGSPGDADPATDEDDADPALLRFDLLSVGSTVFADPNDNGIQDAGEPGIAGVEVQLFQDTNGDGQLTGAETSAVSTVTTDTDGAYLFPNVLPGDYQIQIPTTNFTGALENFGTSSTDVATSGDEFTDSDDNGAQTAYNGLVTSPFFNLAVGMEPVDEGGTNGDQDVELGQPDANGNMTLDFGFLPDVSIGSVVFLDTDNNALLDGAETGVGGVTLDLLFDADNNGAIDAAEESPIATTTTDGDGSYLFANLTPGNYQVVIPATNFDPTGALFMSVLSSNDELDVGADAGAMNVDSDDNGDQPGGVGAVVRSPVISLIPSEEAVDEPGTGGDQDTQDGLFDASGDMTVDFGFAPNVSLGSVVFLDLDDSGTLNGTETGIAGVTVELYFDVDGNGTLEGTELTPVATQTTMADGTYYFDNLPPGDYQVQIPAANFTAGAALAGSVTSSTNIATSDGDNQTDGDDNGLQDAPAGAVTSPIVNLYPAAEPSDSVETGIGGDRDNTFDTSGDMTVDFGFLPNVAIGSTVFFDPNNNAVLDDGEMGISGVTVELLFDADNDGAVGDTEAASPVASAVTDAEGNYLFGDLPPGNYIVRIPVSNFSGGPLDTTLLSSDATLDGDADDQVDNDDNGQQPDGFGTTVTSPLINLAAGQEPVAEESGAGADQDAAFDVSGDMTIDFGFAPNLSLGSTVFLDPDDSGSQDDSEPGLQGVTLELYFDANGDGQLTGAETTPVAVDTTDAEGNYFFDNLPPGLYQVQIPADNFPGGGGLSEAFTSSTDTPGVSDTDSEVDNDDNGQQPGGSGTRVFSPFIDLVPGREPTNEPGSGGSQDAPYDSSGDMTVDFGFLPNVAIGSTVFYDVDNNGEQDAGEGGLAGVSVELYLDANGDGELTGSETAPVRTDVTDDDGNYLFAVLVPGFYQLVIPEGNFTDGSALDSLPNSSNDIATTAGDNQVDGDDNGRQVVSGGTVRSPFIELRPGQEPTGEETGQGGDQDTEFDVSGDMTVDFGFTPNVSIGSTVFLDPDDSGTFGDGETGLPGVVVLLFYDADTSGALTGDELQPVARDTTDGNGNYFFDDLPPGSYQVVIPGENFPGMGGLSQSFTSSTDRPGITDTDNATDGDDNGVQPDGPGTSIFSPFIFLEPGDEVTNTVETGDGGTLDDRYDTSGDMTIDFGFLPNVAVGSTVFFDQNNNGIQDPDEMGIAGVDVDIYLDANRDGMIGPDEDTPLRTVPTDENGNYLFSVLVPGDYQIRIPTRNYGTDGALADLPNSSTDITTTGDDNQIDGDDNGLQAESGAEVVSPIIVLRSGTEPVGAETGQGGDQDTEFDLSGDMTVDFGFIPNVSIGSTVFVDLDADNRQGDDEPGIPDVTVLLYEDVNGDGFLSAEEVVTPTETTITDADGNYYFGDLPPGEYVVRLNVAEFDPQADLFFLQDVTPPSPATDGDNGIDDDNNGLQPGGRGTQISSPAITLLPGREPVGTEEFGPGGSQDDTFDNAGDMTIDFGLLCTVEILAVRARTICSTKEVDLRSAPVISPAALAGTWATSGDGVFLGDSGEELTAPYRTETVASYRPGPNDIRNGGTVLSLTTDQAGLCPPVTVELPVTILEVDCGEFFWDGN